MAVVRNSAEFAECKALVVDDMLPNRELAKALLTTMGIGNLTFAADGVEALEAVAADRPDMVVLDIMMPRMDGFAFLKHFRAMPDCEDIPVLVTTALDTPVDRAKAFDSGATDYIAKPIDHRELKARVSVHLRNRLLVRDLKGYRDRLDQDLKVATAMQAALLPSVARMVELKARYGIDMAAMVRPWSEVSGDLWGWLPVDTNRFAVWLADFSGHGVAAAINTFRLHLILQGGPLENPSAVMTRLNETLADVLPRGQFAAMTYAVCDVRKGKLVFASAGATAPVASSPGNGAGLHPAAALPLGIRKDTHYANVTLPFPPGSDFLLYSDGLSEATGPDGQPVGEDGVLAKFERLRVRNDVAANLSSLIEDGLIPSDDLSAVWLSR